MRAMPNQILEELEKLPDDLRPTRVDAALSQARDHQLDWCIQDLTPETFQAYRAKKAAPASAPAPAEEKKPATRLSATAKQFKFNVAALEFTAGDS